MFYDEAFETEGVDWELGFLVEGNAPPSVDLEDGRTMQQRDLPGLDLAAATMYEGPSTNLHQGYSALGRWTEANGYRVTGVGREVFWHLEPANPEKNVTEIQLPVLPLET